MKINVPRFVPIPACVLPTRKEGDWSSDREPHELESSGALS